MHRWQQMMARRRWHIYAKPFCAADSMLDVKHASLERILSISEMMHSREVKESAQDHADSLERELGVRFSTEE